MEEWREFPGDATLLASLLCLCSDVNRSKNYLSLLEISCWWSGPPIRTALEAKKKATGEAPPSDQT